MIEKSSTSPRFGLLLAPGAGASSDSPALLSLEVAVADEVVVRRMDFPYRLARRRAPDKPAVLLEAVRDQMSFLSKEAGIPQERIFAGGRSMGGRMCSIAAAEGMVTAGLVLLSYPLHPPGKPTNLRVEHFPAIEVPCLFVSGTRDAFGTPDELTDHVGAIPGDVRLEWIEGGDHGMAKHNDRVAELAAGWLRRQMSGSV